MFKIMFYVRSHYAAVTAFGGKAHVREILLCVELDQMLYRGDDTVARSPRVRENGAVFMCVRLISCEHRVRR